jgi:HSP20 family protein
MAIIRRQDRGQGERGVVRHREWDPMQLMRGMLEWDPFEEMRRTLTPGGTSYVPAFDVKESKDAYVFKADLPGVKESDLDISLTGNRLTVSGKREEEHREEDEQYFSYERSYGSFTRSFTLPTGVDLENVNAELKNGELEIRIAKKPEVQARKIPVMKGTETTEKAKA